MMRTERLCDHGVRYDAICDSCGAIPGSEVEDDLLYADGYNDGFRQGQQSRVVAFTAYYQAVEDAKAAIREEARFTTGAASFITAIARKCSPDVYVYRLTHEADRGTLLGLGTEHWIVVNLLEAVASAVDSYCNCGAIRGVSQHRATCRSVSAELAETRFLAKCRELGVNLSGPSEHATHAEVSQ